MTCNCEGAAPAGDYNPVRVHLAGSDVPLAGQAAAPRKIRVATFFTRNLGPGTNEGAVIDLLPYDPSRVIAYAQAGGSNVIIASDIGAAQDAANQAAGQPAPDGMVLTAGNTQMTPVEGCQRMWAAAAAAAQVTVQVVHEREAL